MDKIKELNEKERIEWLVSKLIKTEEERDSALDRLEEVSLENLSLRGKLSAIGYILCDEGGVFDFDDNAVGIPDATKSI